MIAVDTNIVIRLLTTDEAAQAERAKALFATETIFLAKTVILESEWILRRLYKIGHAETLDALSALASLANVRCEDENVLVQALAWAGQGLDFADAFHLASADGGVEKFATFDKDFVKRGRVIGETPVYLA